MDVSESESGKVGEMEILHFSHPHPLVFITQQEDHQSFASDEDHQSFAVTTKNCFGCNERLEDEDGGWRYYGCKECKYYLHKECAELELASQIDHPFHPKHLLSLLPKSPYKGRYQCNFCHRASSGFVYHCDVCKFDLHINCALLESSIATNLPNSLHPHPLFFLPNHDKQVIPDCSGCKEPLSGPIYHCSDCSYKSDFNLHKECAELPLEINHPYDRNHPLTLLPNPPSHPEKCSCYLCKIHWKGFVYSCSLCDFEFRPEDVRAPRTITNATHHQHPWTLVI